MPVSAVFRADFSSFLAAIDKADIKMADFAKGAEKVGPTLNRMIDQFSGRKLIQEAHLMSIAIEKAGGIAQLTGKELERVGNQASEAAEKMKKLGYEVPPGLQKIADASKQTGGVFSNLATEIAKTAAGFITAEAVIGGVKAAFSSLIGVATGAIATASHIDDLSKATGISTDRLQELGFAGKRVGLELDDLAILSNQLAKRIATGDGSAVKAIQGLGLSLENLKHLSPDELFIQVTEAVKGIQDPILQAGVGSELFGKQFGAAMRLAKDGIRDTLKEAKDFNAVISHDAIASLDRFGDKVGDLTLRLKAMAAEALAPILDWLTKIGTASDKKSLSGFIDPEMARQAKEFGGAIGATIPNLSAYSRGFQIAAGSVEALDRANKTGLTSTQFVENQLKALEANALTPLTAAQQRQIVKLGEWGKSESDIATLIGSNVEAVHRYSEAHKKATEELKKWREANIEVQAAAGGFGKTLDSMSGDLIETIKFFLEAGVSVNALATAYGLTDVQIKAIATSRDVDNKLLALNTTVTIANADALSKLGQVENEEIRLIKERVAWQTTLQKIEFEAASTIGEGLDKVGRKVRVLTDDQEKLLQQAEQWRKDLDGLAGAFAQLAQISGASFGGIVQDVARVISAWNLATKSAQAFFNATTKAGKAAAAVSGIAAVASATGSGSTISRTAGGAISGFVTGAAIGSIVPGIGTAIGAAIGAIGGGLAGLFRGIFGQNLEKQINPIREAFVQAAGGLSELNKRAQEAGVTLTALLDAKNPEAYQKAIEDLNAAFKFQDDAMATLEATTKKYGFTIEELGPKFAAQQLDKQAQGLFQDFQVLTGAGIDIDTVLKKMGGSIQDFITSALKVGSEVPEALRPMLQRMVELGLLTDANGVVITDLEKAGIHFSQSMTEGFAKVVSAVEKLTEAIARGLGIALDDVAGKADAAGRAIERIPDVRVPVIPNVPDFGPLPFSGGGVVMDRGIGGRVLPFKPRGTDTVPAMLTPGEVVLNKTQQAALLGGGGEPITLVSHITVQMDGQIAGQGIVTQVARGKRGLDVQLKKALGIR